MSMKLRFHMSLEYFLSNSKLNYKANSERTNKDQVEEYHFMIL
jgi:hypothetical protein